ncbi:MAG: pentapeptide repeat-containing protein [Bacteroidetes Order II. Incertae sedis bacterium]|nr:pentapeptide repeat-containing protein [Bacteroidetes Order II. bacterium]
MPNAPRLPEALEDRKNHDFYKALYLAPETYIAHYRDEAAYHAAFREAFAALQTGPDAGKWASIHFPTDIVFATGLKLKNGTEFLFLDGFLMGAEITEMEQQTGLEKWRWRFDDEIEWQKRTFDFKLHLSKATFSGNAAFGAATFSGNANFYAATFSGNAAFGTATFSGDANFGAATFSGDAAFYAATFSGNANFGAATFSGDAAFGAATFSGDAYFGFLNAPTALNSAKQRLEKRIAALQNQGSGLEGEEQKRAYRGLVRQLGLHLRALENPQPIFHCKQTLFLGDVSFGDSTFAGAFSFEQCFLQNGVSFQNATFSERAVFEAPNP